MNKQRRKQIYELSQKISDLKEELDEILQEEQDYYDNMPESLQYSERGESSEKELNMRRDKIITIRVDSDLLKQVQDIIDSRTSVWQGRRNYYHYIDENGYSHEKYTIADLLEKAMREYVKNVPKGTK